MREQVSERIASLCAAVDIESETTYRFAGRQFEVPAPKATSPASSSLSALSPQLEVAAKSLVPHLYQQGYCWQFENQYREPPETKAPDPSFVQSLEDANQSRDRVEVGWLVQSVDSPGRVLAEKNGKIRSFSRGEYRPVTPGLMSVVPGVPIQVHLAKGSLSMQPGFYVVFSEALADPGDAAAGALRIYFNVSATGAPRLVEIVTCHLNRFQVPFTFKTLTQRTYYERRADSAVLFLHRRFFPIASQMLSDLASELNGEMGAAVPLFTKEVAPGVGLAEDPGTGDSFGLSRCRLLSDAIWQAFSNGEVSVEGRLAEVEDQFSRAGLSLDHPYLNPRSVDRYQPVPTEGGP